MSLFKQIYDFLTCITSFFPTFTLSLLPFKLFLTFSKTTTMKKFLLLGLFVILATSTFGQIYSEDFTGQNGKGAVGPAPTTDLIGVDWTIDISSASLSATSDWFQVQSEIMEGRDLDGDAIWFSPSIDISGFTDVQFSLAASESGTMEASDIFKTEYRIDGGAWTIATTNGSLNDDFISATVSQTGLAGATLELKVTMNNGAGSEYHRLDDVVVTGTPLPIELVSFRANQNSAQVAVTWETATETNNEYFTIERSAEGSRFEAIGKVKGAGNSTTALRYEFVDNAPMRGTNYYRLTQTDYDGKSESFDVVSVDFKGAGTTTIRPTQVKDIMTLSLESMESVGRVTIFNLVGQKVYSQVIEPGSTNMEIDASAFAQGQYVARVSTGNFVETVRFIKL